MSVRALSMEITVTSYSALVEPLLEFWGQVESVNNLRYSGDTTVMAETKEELKKILMKVKEESEKDGLKLNIQKMTITA